MSSAIASTYSVSSLAGLVSSSRRLQRPPELGGDAEVQADRLGVADVQVAVGFRGEPGLDPAAVLSRRHVVGDDLAEEIEAAGARRAGAGTIGGSGSHLRGAVCRGGRVGATEWEGGGNRVGGWGQQSGRVGETERVSGTAPGVPRTSVCPDPVPTV